MHGGSPGSSWEGLVGRGTGASLSTTGSQWGRYGPPGHTGQFCRHFGLSHLRGEGVAGTWRIEAGDAGKHSVGYRAAPPTRNAPTPNANSAQVEKPCSCGLPCGQRECCLGEGGPFNSATTSPHPAVIGSLPCVCTRGVCRAPCSPPSLPRHSGAGGGPLGQGKDSMLGWGPLPPPSPPPPSLPKDYDISKLVNF